MIAPAKKTPLTSTPHKENSQKSHPEQPTPSDARYQIFKETCARLIEDQLALGNLVEDYVNETRRSPAESDLSDYNRFLTWLKSESQKSEKTQSPPVMQQPLSDAVTFHLLRKRIAHRRFQQLVNNREQIKHTGTSSCLVHLNPVYVWAKSASTTSESGEAGTAATQTTSTTLFYAIHGEVKTVIMSEIAERIVKELESRPRKLKSLVKLFSRSTQQLASDTIEHLLRLHVLAIS